MDGMGGGGCLTGVASAWVGDYIRRCGGGDDDDRGHGMGVELLQ